MFGPELRKFAIELFDASSPFEIHEARRLCGSDGAFRIVVVFTATGVDSTRVCGFVWMDGMALGLMTESTFRFSIFNGGMCPQSANVGVFKGMISLFGGSNKGFDRLFREIALHGLLLSPK